LAAFLIHRIRNLADRRLFFNWNVQTGQKGLI
jgi:hypothetical protein